MIAQFVGQLLGAIADFYQWLQWLSQRLGEFTFDTKAIEGSIGMYRYLVGETVYMLQVTIIYISALMLAAIVIPNIAALWKKISPFH